MTVKESHQNYNRTAEAVIVLPFLNNMSNCIQYSQQFISRYCFIVDISECQHSNILTAQNPVTVDFSKSE
jgi:hypothetical protein